MILTVTLNAAIDKRYVVEEFKVGEVNRVKECAYVPGGKGLNVSKPAAVAGAEVVATGFVGGHAGNYIEASLKDYHVKSAFYHLESESRSCINIWDEKNCVQTEFLEPGFTVTESEFQGFVEEFKELVKKADVVAMSGSVPKGEKNCVQTEFLEPGFTVTESEFQGFVEEFKELVKKADVVAMSGSVPKGLDGTAYQKLVKVVKDAGKKVILDTSGKLLEMGIEACPTMIKPNIDEIRMLTGKECNEIGEIIEAAKEIHARGVEVVAVSLGADGSLAVSDEGVFRAIVPRIDAVNTVGCGDSMIAGFALGFAEGLGIEETLRKASAISAAAALREETGYFVMEDMQRLYPQIKIEKM